ncbi:HD domain-containing protein [Vibrio sp. CAIM 722]|uniref:HD domain-containing protein n=3 Tax=Vibrionaceae TaxID=641 RepID=A0A7X4RWH4_9VIBR|nr:bifunctional (p)ppGpp synthetase/guanosine-3',5'-bis(diphosphate) 3'-pyrophosphohydrolase [Vibrio nitrifigilis]MZI95380.1 HD domain-containing protein [Vibrio eleionomae]
MNRRAKDFATYYHGEQKYGADPYLKHLEAVAILSRPYGAEAVTIAYLHDVVEDTAVTLDVIEKQFGPFIARCVSILTDQPGDTRAERKAKTYERMSHVAGREKIALVVKAADRLSNLRMCCITQDKERMAMYQQEHPQFKQCAYRKGLCDEFWLEMNELIDKGC